jgi:hypothetical protein
MRRADRRYARSAEVFYGEKEKKERAKNASRKKAEEREKTCKESG